jgi:hypothetical protein
MFHPASAYLGLSGLTDGAGAAAFERLAGFATRLLGVPAAFVSLVDRDAVVGASDVAGAGPCAPGRRSPARCVAYPWPRGCRC